MRFFRRSLPKDNISSEGTPYSANLSRRMKVQPDVVYPQIRAILTMTFEWQSLSQRMQLNVPISSEDRTSLAAIWETAQSLDPQMIDTGIWPQSWQSLSTTDPRFVRSQESRNRDARELKLAFDRLCSMIPFPDNVDLVNLQLFIEFYVSHSLNRFYAEDMATTARVKGDQREFDAQLQDWKEFSSLAERTLPFVTDGLRQLRLKHPNQYSKLNLSSADLYSLGIE